MFSQPARRSARFRHQTNSFSFDESERASAVYEQDRVVSSSTTNSKVRPSNDLNLRAELRGSSLETSSSHSSASSETSESSEITSIRNLATRTRQSGDQEFILSSPQLPLLPESLPPPFSSTSRSVSGAASLPLIDNDPHSGNQSPAESPSVSSYRGIAHGKAIVIPTNIELMEPILSNPVSGISYCKFSAVDLTNFSCAGRR